MSLSSSFRHSTSFMNQGRHSVMAHSTGTPNITSSSETQPSESASKVPGFKEFEIEFGHGVSEVDKSLSRRDKNAVDFVFNYSKLWCKTCKDVVICLEKRAYAENEACRSIVKQFQILEASLVNVVGAPMRQQLSNLARTLIEHSREIEMHNTKRCRELLEVLTRQRVLFEKTRKFLKDKWKADVKRLIDAENSLIKTKSAYYQRCQTGVKLREELSAAQTLLNELNASVANASNVSATPSVPGLPGGISTGTPGSSSLQGLGATMPSNSTSYSVGVPPNPFMDSAELTTDQSSTTTAGTTSTTNQIAKQKAKVERLEKQLSDNDRKEIEQMYSYREAVENANNRLYELEKSKMEIICDIRLTIMKSDEVVKDSLAELFNHIHSTRLAMINQYESLASGFQGFVPCSDYRALIDEHIQKGVDCFPEKYQFAGFHERSGLKSDSLSGRFFSRTPGSTRETTECDPLSAIFHLVNRRSTPDVIAARVLKPVARWGLFIIFNSNLKPGISTITNLPEPLLTYNLYPNFVELGKIIDAADVNIQTELVKRLQVLINHLSPTNKKLAGLLFHHLNRVSACQSENLMSSANLGTMFAPTVLRQKPKFQVANMMDLMDNKGQARIVELLIDSATDIFGPPELYDPICVLLTAESSFDVAEGESRRSSGETGKQTSPRLSIRAHKDEERKLVVPHLASFRTHSSQHSTTSSVASEESASTGSQHSLIRSATISATSPGRASVLLSSPLPLYTPFESSQSLPRSRGQDLKESFTPSDGELESSSVPSNYPPATTSITNAPVKLIQLAETGDVSASRQPQQAYTATSVSNQDCRSESLLAMSQAAARGVSNPDSDTSTAHVPTSGYKTVACTFKKELIPTRKHPLGDRSATPAVTSALSNLVIGRGRLGVKRFGTSQPSATSQPNNSGDAKDSTDLDDYGYIDTDPSDSPTS
ncbi:unnamed protein product [Dicrocoelium dendriticum]|nr:unnamed protein product [Dicrocoelium dendriticum]